MISEKADTILNRLYSLYSSYYGSLFGIPPEYKQGVRAVVEAVLTIYEHDINKVEDNE